MCIHLTSLVQLSLRILWGNACFAALVSHCVCLLAIELLPFLGGGRGAGIHVVTFMNLCSPLCMVLSFGAQCLVHFLCCKLFCLPQASPTLRRFKASGVQCSKVNSAKEWACWVCGWEIPKYFCVPDLVQMLTWAHLFWLNNWHICGRMKNGEREGAGINCWSLPCVQKTPTFL